MVKVLWLASWFPNAYKPLAGDFIKRHAEAVSIFQSIHVIHVERINDNKKKISKKVELTDELFPGLSYTIRYYTILYLFGIERIYSYPYSLWLYHSQIKCYIKENGKPDILHVHIALRCGLVALYYKWIYGIPYLITEQFTGYLTGTRHYQKGISFFSRFLLRFIFRNAEVVTPVSETLGQALHDRFKIKRVKVIHNVVNTSIFYPLVNQAEKTVPVFIHISTLTPQKNPEQMLKAFAILKEQFGIDFALWVIGPHNQDLVKLASKLNIHNEIEWHKETTQPRIAKLLQKSDALVLYSRFETFGCVNIEAMACGIPVIASDIPVFREYLQNGFTAYFAEPENPMKLALTIRKFLKVKKKSPLLISKQATNFDYATIGSKIYNLYMQLFEKNTQSENRTFGAD